MADKKWIQKAVNPKHKGYCTPMTKPTCTGHRRALALRFKAMAKERKKHANGGYITMDEWVDKVHQGCPDCALEALHEAMDVYEEGGEIYVRYEEGGAINPALASTLSLGLNAILPGSGAVVDPLMGIVNQIKQKQDMNKVLSDHFKSLNQSTNPYGNYENGGPVADTVKQDNTYVQPVALNQTLPNLPPIPKSPQPVIVPKESGYSGSGSKSKSYDKLYEKELGGVINNENLRIYKGPSHANGGIPVSLSGTPSTNPVAEVEGDEVSYNVGGRSYIFSKKLTVK